MVVALCTGGDEPPGDPGRTWLNKAQRVVAADGGLRLLRRWGRVADLWIGDRDSLDGDWSEWKPWTREVILLSRDKALTDTQAAIEQILRQPVDEVWMLGGAGGRMDHWWSNWKLWEQEPRLTRWLTAHEEAVVLQAGTSTVLKPGVVSIVALGGPPYELLSHGLRWPLKGFDFAKSISLSNEAEDGATLKSISGRFLIIFPRAVEVVS